MNDAIPEGPAGVWLEFEDGTRIDDVPTIFTGYDDNGIAQFDLLMPRDEAPVRAGAATWPGLTALRIPLFAPGTEIP